MTAATSIGYSASASATYLAREGFAKRGEPPYAQAMAKSKKIVKHRVATSVPRGDLEIGFRHVSESLPARARNSSDPFPRRFVR